MAVSLMDVWNIETFDGNLLAELKANETLGGSAAVAPCRTVGCA